MCIFGGKYGIGNCIFTFFEFGIVYPYKVCCMDNKDNIRLLNMLHTFFFISLESYASFTIHLLSYVNIFTWTNQNASCFALIECLGKGLHVPPKGVIVASRFVQFLTR